MSIEAISTSQLHALLLPSFDVLELVDEHVNDGDQPEPLAHLLNLLARLKRTTAEVYQATERAYLACAGDKKLEVPGLGLVECHKRTKRTNWLHEDLWKDITLKALEADEDPVEALWSASRPTWRVSALKALGLDPDEYCQTEADGWSVQLPSQDLEERFS